MHKIEDQELSTGLAVGLWLLAGVSLLAFLGGAPANRAQEARVLVTAREMVQGGGDRWLLPTCNGELRVQKPPMAYWAAAAMFRATGQVSELAGRLPSALWAWLTLGVVYAAGARWFSRPVGLLASGMLLTSFLFYRYGRLAETDIPATLAVTVAITAFWRGLEPGDEVKAPRRAALWCALGGVATGVAFLAKQGPGLYPLLFALVFGILRRNWKGLAVTAWAGIVPVILIAAPWYVYIVAKGYGGVFWTEAAVAAEGKDHAGGVLVLVQFLIIATAPWFGLWPAGVILAWLGPRPLLRISSPKAHVPRRNAASRALRAIVIVHRRAFRQNRRRPAIQAILCWVGATLLPLLFVRNKQIHYLMPAVPPLMLLSAWAVEQAAKSASPRVLGSYVRLSLQVLMSGAIVAGSALLGWATAMAAGTAKSADPHFPAATAILGVLLLATALLMRTPVHAGLPLTVTVRATAGLAAVFVWLIGVWAVQIQPEDVHMAARSIQTVAGSRRLMFYGEPSLALVFQLDRVIPVVGKRYSLSSAAANGSALVVESAPGDLPVKLPPPWHLAWRGGPAGHHYQLWLPAESPTTRPASSDARP